MSFSTENDPGAADLPVGQEVDMLEAKHKLDFFLETLSTCYCEQLAQLRSSSELK